MKVKIKCSVSDLVAQGLPRNEAVRLSGNLFTAIRNTSHSYYEVPGTDRDGEPRVWLFGDSEVELVYEPSSALDLSKPVQQRDGCPVEIKYIDESLEYSINGIVTCKNGKKFTAGWHSDGSIYSDGSPCENDLIQAPEPLIEGWLNVYNVESDQVTLRAGNTIHRTKESADECADPGRTACIKISYRKGEGLL